MAAAEGGRRANAKLGIFRKGEPQSRSNNKSRVKRSPSVGRVEGWVDAEPWQCLEESSTMVSKRIKDEKGTKKVSKERNRARMGSAFPKRRHIFW